MALTIRRADYFRVTVADQPGEAFKLLSLLASGGVNLLAFIAVPLGPEHAQFTLFPEDVPTLARVAEENALLLDGPHPALLVQGEDRLGALAGIHARLSRAGVNVYFSAAVTDGKGDYGYIIHVQPRDIAAATSALGA
jgi:hypothetical protein